MLESLQTQVGGDHYQSMKIQPAEYILANGLGKYEGDVIEKVSRWKTKNGIEDLEKAQHALQILIDFHAGQKTVPEENSHAAAIDAARFAQLQADKNAQLQQN